MNRTRIAVALFSVATISAGCTETPTSIQRAQPTRPAFDGGGYMGNGGRSVAPQDSTKTSASTDSTVTTTEAAAGGGYMGNGG